MSQTAKGKKVMSAMTKEYGAKKGKSVYYAMIVKGKLKGAEGSGGTGKLAKAKRTYGKKHKKFDGEAFAKAKKKHFGMV